MKKLFIVLLVLIIFLFIFTRIGDRALIKMMRSGQISPFSKAMNIDIEYLGKVEGYRIYYAESYSKGYLGDRDTVDGYIFETKLFSNIIGIKYLGFYTLGELLYERDINGKKLYEVLPEKTNKSMMQTNDMSIEPLGVAIPYGTVDIIDTIGNESGYVDVIDKSFSNFDTFKYASIKIFNGG